MSSLVIWYDKHKNNIKSFKDDVEYLEILNITSFLNEFYNDISLSQRIWHIKNAIFEIQRCKYCISNMVKFDNTHRIYLNCCCKTCQNELQKTDLWKQLWKKQYFEKHGVEYENDEDLKIKIKNTKENIDDNIRKDKQKLTFIKNFGVEHNSKTQEFKDGLYKINFEKYNNILIKYGLIQQGYILINYYKNQRELFCPKCKTNFLITPNQIYSRNIYNQEICTKCNPSSKPYSVGEKELLKYVSSIYNGKIIENARFYHKVNKKRFEIDIYLPDLKLGIEYNGDFWHANPMFYKESDILKLGGKSNINTAKQIWEKDVQKINLIKEIGISLLIFWEYDWENRKLDIEEIIKNKITK